MGSSYVRRQNIDSYILYKKVNIANRKSISCKGYTKKYQKRFPYKRFNSGIIFMNV